MAIEATEREAIGATLGFFHELKVTLTKQHSELTTRLAGVLRCLEFWEERLRLLNVPDGDNQPKTAPLVETPKSRTTTKPGVVPPKRVGRPPAEGNVIERLVTLLQDLGPGDAPGMSVALIADRLQVSQPAVASAFTRELGPGGLHRVVRVSRGLYGLPPSK